jgi:hypothetical protein
LQNNSYDESDNYLSLLKITLKSAPTGVTPIIINSGFYDNRTAIGRVNYDEEWVLDVQMLDEDGDLIDNPYNSFDFELREIAYNTKKGNYSSGKLWASTTGSQSGGVKTIKFNSSSNKTGNNADVNVSEEDFKKKEIKLLIKPKVLPSSQGEK